MMATRRSLFVSTLALGGAGLVGVPLARAAQGTPQPAADGAILVPVEVKEFEVDADQTVFRTGQAYRFAIRNRGRIPHEFVIEPDGAMDAPLEDDGRGAEAADIAPGTTASLQWTFRDPGRYMLACHVPGHYEAGMHTAIEVIDAADAQVVEVEVAEFTITVSPASVAAGSPVAFVVRNAGKIVHEFVAQPAGAKDEPFEHEDEDDDGDGEAERESEIEGIEPGTVREMVWTFETPGTVDLACHVPGHYEAGMVASLEVTG